MKTTAAIQSRNKTKRPFMQQGKREPFIKSDRRINKEEDKAAELAGHALSKPAIVQLKPMTEPGDRTPHGEKALEQAGRITAGEQGKDSNTDLLPAWCGIFVFWELHKSGIHLPPWKAGSPNFTSVGQYENREYPSHPVNTTFGNGYEHSTPVVNTDPGKENETRELPGLQAVSINGSTANSNHTGGQMQANTDLDSRCDCYVNPLFKAVEVTEEKDFKPGERLKRQSDERASIPSATPGIAPANTDVHQYNTSPDTVQLHLPKDEPAEGEKKSEEEKPPVSPEQIMKEDTEFAEIQGSLDRNAKNEKAHDPAKQKAEEAQASAVSPPNERLSGAQAKKIESFEDIKIPPFRAKDLKDNILKEVHKVLEERKAATPEGEKPMIGNDDVKKVKEKSGEDIAGKKKESVGDVQEANSQPPDIDAEPKRDSAEKIIENAGPVKHIPGTEKAVAKPVADERITLEKESGKIDTQMTENDVDEQQLEESNEDKFTGALGEKRGSQQQAAAIKTDYRAIETGKLDKDRQIAKEGIDSRVAMMHAVRGSEFDKVNAVKDATQTADEKKRGEVSEKIGNIYASAEKSVNDKLEALDKSVNEAFDAVMVKANENFKVSVNNALDEEFSWEWFSKTFSSGEYKRRVKKVFDAEQAKYEEELSKALDPLTTKIADTLNAIIDEIQAARKAVKVYVDGLPADLKDIGIESANAVMEKFNALQDSVNEKQQALTNSIAKKYADGVMALEEEFKKIMDSRKSWLEKALDAIVDAIKEILQLLADLKKALERAAEYGRRIIKAPLRFFSNLCKGASEGFNNFVKNIGKHLLQGALEWITGQMGDAGIVLPDKFDFKGILSIILQILGISIQNMKEIARKVIGEKYVTMLEKGADLGVKAGDKILQVFTIVKKDGLAGLWEFIREQFNDLKERLMEEAKSFIVTTIVETAVVKVVSMLIPGAGFISAVKSLIDFLRTLFAKARQIVSIITGIIDTFGEILAGNVSKVSGMVEKVLAKFLGLAITFLAAILGLGKIGKKINDIIQKKIKDPINKAITKMMEKLKQVMTKLGIFKFLDKVDEKIKKGKQWVEDKKDAVKQKASATLGKLKGFLGNLFDKYTDESGETHTLRFKGTDLYRESVSKTMGNYLIEVRNEINGISNTDERKKHAASITKAFSLHKKIVDLIGETVKLSSGKYTGADKGFNPAEGEKLRGYLKEIAAILRVLPLQNKKKFIPKTKIAYRDGVADGQHAKAIFISLDSDEAGSKPEGDNSPLSQNIINIVEKEKGKHKLVRGHLINHELFGTGAELKNLAPIPKKANSAMLTAFETDAKKLVHENNVIALDVTMVYGDPADTMKNGKSLLKEKLPADTKIPTNIKFILDQLIFTGPENSPQAAVNNRKNWTKTRLKADTLSINHDDFF
ncbi:MAG: DNA/RNA non-specific endonuclease [Chitinophagaceae bacterium]|nr:DNA/RNA non-specific endonuclease [Chitinophagaceae bacterium]